MKSISYGPKISIDMHKFMILLACAALSLPAIAQNDELNKLADIVISLKSGGEKSYKSAISTLANDNQWTPMDELGIDKEAECRASERPPGFRLNAVLTNAENKERYQTTTGNHLNGADSRYSYSLFEKTLKAGKSVSYRLPERWGEQTFIVIPYSGKISTSISSGGKPFSSTPLSGGAVRLTGSAVKGSPIEISVRNDGQENVSYVIINYNSRK